MRTRVVSSLLLVMLALAAVGCGAGGSSPASTSSSPVSSAPSGTAQHGTVVYGKLPPVGTPKPGGTVSFGQITGNTPTEVFPMLDDPNTSTADFELNGAMFLSLYAGPNGAVPEIDYAQSVASAPPRFSDGNRTLTIPLRQGLRWSNGAPVDANDVLFYIALCKAAVKESAANWSQFIPGQFPQSVTSMSAPNSHTVVLHLDRSYNPGYFIEDQMQDTGGGLYPMPSTDWNVDRTGGPHLANWRRPAVAKAIYDYLSKAGTKVSTFASDPLWKDVDGAFTLTRFSATDGSFELAPNPRYGLAPKPRFSTLSVQTYTSETAALNALTTGGVDIVPLDSSQLGEAASLRSQGISVFGAPGFAWAGGVLNFKDKTHDFDHVIAQLYVRQALAHLVDEPGFIKGLYKGTAAADYGPVPSAPSSPYAPAGVAKPPYPYDPAAAVALLRAHGWKVAPGGETRCVKPGTGTAECGASIPAGTTISFNWMSAPASSSTAELTGVEAIASVALQRVGIHIAVQVKSSDTIEDYDDADPSNAKFTNDWGAVTTDTVALIDYYPTQAGFDIPGAVDIGGFDDPVATRDMNASVHSGNLHAVEREAVYLARDLPELFLPNPDVLYATRGVGGPAGSWTSLSEGSTIYPEYWYRTG
ncbi:MAG TPA: ABC transporter substrate-binding protein [Solirubrobacteraceae bacterium]|nr:ABC transporter substrate-binding protein [Solirubrobacteraceae bacterium]